MEPRNTETILLCSEYEVCWTQMHALVNTWLSFYWDRNRFGLCPDALVVQYCGCNTVVLNPLGSPLWGHASSQQGSSRQRT